MSTQTPSSYAPRLRPAMLGVLAALGAVAAAPVYAASTTVVISEFRTRGPSGGNDEFVELYNLSASQVNIGGWKINGSNNAGTAGTRLTIAANTLLNPGCRFLATNSASGGYSGSVAGNQTYSTGITDDGGVALLNASNTVIDAAGMSSGSAYKEGTVLAPTTTSKNQSYERKPAGTNSQDSDNNNNDFLYNDGASNPQNLSSNCTTGGAPSNPSVNLSVSANSGSEAAQSAITVTATASAAVAGDQSVTLSVGGGGISSGDYTLNDTTAGSVSITIPGGSTAGTATFKVVDDALYEGSETAVLTLSSPSAGLALGATLTQSIVISDNDPAPVACSATDTPIGQIQGAGAAAALTGTRTVQGVVVGDFEGASSLDGFYLQNAAADADGDAATSDAIFVFNGNGGNNVSLGQVVQVTGAVVEYQNQTEISGPAIEQCGATGSVSPATLSLPVSAPSGGVDYLERYEGMLVAFPQTLYVTEHFQLGRFGQVLLSSGGKLSQPTNVAAPGAAAAALQASNALNQILLDDELQTQNPDPIKFGRGGAALSAANTLRGGDNVANLTGVLTYGWSGNAASGNAWRLRPINALNGSGAPNFQIGNPRPTVPAQVNGRLKVASANLLNFFNTFTLCSNGLGGTPDSANCRGAGSAAEYQRQWQKTVKNLVGTGAAVLLVNEMENNGYGAGSAIQDLVNKLDAEAGAAGTYAFINPDAASGQSNAQGTDAIKVGILYKPAVVTPVGTTAPLNTGALGLFHTGAGDMGRSRPSLAQAFLENASGATFIAVANHLKSKGSSCGDNLGLATATLSTTSVVGDSDAGDGQGECNKTRTAAAEELVGLLLTRNPTGTNDPNILLAGDLNAYAKEDPVTTLKNAGFINLIESRIGAGGYSYVFSGQWGYIDNALASASLEAQVADVLEWHINADEPSVLDYSTSFKSAGQLSSLYAQDAFRTSDHDPIVVGLNLATPAVATITGGSGPDSLAGTAGPDRLIGLAGRDTLTGGGGRDQFVYNSVQDGVDTVTDFTANYDTLVLTGLLQSLGIHSANPLATGHVVCAASGASNSLVSIDPDGAAGPAVKRSMIQVNNIGCAALAVSANFTF